MDIRDVLDNDFNINRKVTEFCCEAEAGLSGQFKHYDKVAEINQLKVLKSMQKNKLSEAHFSPTTGYGYNDLGRDALENIYADVFKCESALVRAQIISGTHALTLALFGNLKYGDELLSPVGKPYDTLEGVIGIKKTKSSLIEYGITYKQVDLLEDGSFDYQGIKNAISNKTKLVTIQRSKGYSLRHSLSVEEIGQLIKFIKSIKADVICMVDNCYGEFVDIIEPSEVGADIIVGSLIKNPGGGLAPVGGYIAGKYDFVENAAIRLTAPGLGFEVGPSLGVTQSFAQGLFMAPQIVCGCIKGAILASTIFENLGFSVYPNKNEKRSDIVQAIKLQNEKNIVTFCQAIQAASAVDSFVKPYPSDMPGYDSKVIMAAGAFVQGSSIELSADAPIKEPFAVYMQGGLSYTHSKIALILAVNNMYENNLIKL
ncbi:MAG: methionine gamma-lyase family protein [Clostridiales bacterium]|jgi:cystathionine beta-lyase family protein involved in aluminum resistance|nr:methionine gamma-lyase family protein [Clostridiales bacterium]